MPFGLIELVFVTVVVLGFGLWELANINRTLREDRARKEEDRDETQQRDGPDGSA